MDNLYFDNLRAVLEDLTKRNCRLSIYCELFERMRNLSQAHRDFQRSDTPESEALARWRMNDAKDRLGDYVVVVGFESDLERLIMSVAESPLSST